MAALEQKSIDTGLEFLRLSQRTDNNKESWHYCQMALSQFTQARWINPQNWEASYYEAAILNAIALLPEGTERQLAIIDLNPRLRSTYPQLCEEAWC